MPWSTEYECDRCHRVYEVTTCDLRYYVLPDGRQVSCRICPVWCVRCGVMTEGELIPPLDSVEWFVKEQAPALDDEARMCAETNMTWRRLRQSPPRCLRCGATEIIAVSQTAEGRSESLEHPGCGGVLRDRNSCIHYTPDAFWTYTVEGVPLNHKWRGWFSRWLYRRLHRMMQL